MQSVAQANSGPNPETTAPTEQPLDTGTEAQSALSQPHGQEENTKAEAPVATEAGTASLENQVLLQTAATSATVAVAQAVEKEPAVQPLSESSENPPAMEKLDSALKSAPESASNKNLMCDGQKTKKQNKGPHEGKKYVLSKKAMVDPLKMDMSKPVVMPLTSSQLSLQCIECHIIFSDHKSKERHLKSSHPAEYEQCILRNALFACYVCDRHFTNSTELMAHQRAHIEKKPFKCPICGVAFNKSSELTRHKKIHFGQDGYACTDCGKPCKTLTLLRYHSRTHTGERPYICKECGKRFTMSKALQKHILLHQPEGAEEGEGNTTAKTKLKKKDGASTVKYSCSMCKAKFKSSKTQLHHMKTKHNMLPAAGSSALPAGQQVKQYTPIITPISVCQPGLLQVEPNGPLQKVDSNIDTEQICRLIESLGNVQKVNQVVILGQVPPHAPPLELQPIPQQAEPVNPSPPQIDFIGQSESKIAELDSLNNQCDSMEQTIILEPITPDGQLENVSFSELGSHIATSENLAITLVPTEHTERTDGKVMHQVIQSEISTIQSGPLDQMVCQNELNDLKQNLLQTVVLELTPALISTLELEQSQTAAQHEIPHSSLVLPTGLERTPDLTVIEEQTSLLVPPLMSTIELELTTLQTEQQGQHACLSASADTPIQTTSPSETSPKEHVDSQDGTVSLEQIHCVDGVAQETQEKAEQELSQQEPSEKLLVHHNEDQEQLSIKVKDASDKEEVPPQCEIKQVPQMSELPVNVMSAQELVKVRKRKPPRGFIFQGYLQEQSRSIHMDNFQIDTSPAKRQRTKKSHLLVKFGPQSKEKKSKKQKRPSQQHQPTKEKEITTNPSEKKTASQMKGRKGKKDRKMGRLLSTAEIKSLPSTEDQRVQQIKGNARKNKMKKQTEDARESVMQIGEHKTLASAVFKKKKQTKIMRKDQRKNAKDGKKRKNLPKDQSANTKTVTAPADTQGPHITPDSLLLLKGHKQPQLKVYKLDPSKASGPTQEASSNDSQTVSQQSRDNKHPTSESTNDLTVPSKKKGGRPKKNQKALSLSTLHVSGQPPEMLPIKPKTTRKRKASSKEESEEVINSSHSKRAFECNDCGERFCELASLQRHKATVHIVESPSLTFTNGNIFEGVSRLNLPKQHKVMQVMNAAADWDTELELGEMASEDREQTVSFPALIPSPSLPVPPPDVEVDACEDKAQHKTEAEIDSHTSADVHSSSAQVNNNQIPQTMETEQAVASEETVQEKVTLKNNSSETEVQANVDEDIKEDFLLEVDLVTVGDQIERGGLATSQESAPLNKSKGTCNSESVSTEKQIRQGGETTTDKNVPSQTVACSTDQVVIKDEEEEKLVQKKKQSGREAVTRIAMSRRKCQPEHQKRGEISEMVLSTDASKEIESEKEQDECQVVYEKHPNTSDSEVCDEVQTDTRASQPETNSNSKANKATDPVACFPIVPSTLEESSEEQVVFELESVTTSVEEVMREEGPQGGEDHIREIDQSPGIILEKFLTLRQRETADTELCLLAARNNQKQNLDCSGNQEIKVEETMSDPQTFEPTCQNRHRTSVPLQHQRDIRTVLVKEESRLVLNDAQTSQGSGHIRWNVEPVNSESTTTPLMQGQETSSDCCVTPEFNNTQCIFYPVKEEEREVLVGPCHANIGSLTPEGSGGAHQSEPRGSDSDLYDGSHTAQEYQEIRMRGLLSEPGETDFADVQAEADAEWPNPSELRDFLLQNSEEEEMECFDLSDPQLNSEAEVMTYFHQNKNNGVQQLDHMSQNLSSSASQLQAPSDENRTRAPIDYFSKYFGWDTWLEISRCTNQQSRMPNPITAREVAQLVGIHIAMGTLKFPSLRLYWEDLTKVPLISEAMPLSRFMELLWVLKLASTTKDPVNNSAQEGQCNDEPQNERQVQTLPSRQCVTLQHSCRQSQCETNNLNCSKTQTNPLWKVQPLLSRFKAGCQSLRRVDDYAVDQYLLPLTAKLHNNKLSLHCTTLIGFGGLLVHVDLKLNLSDKEDAVEKMVPRGSMVFLCKQELSTPAMLERLLVAGVHGAGRVGGARGQIGDEFVSSDGKLMLRRSHCGFILSTAGNGQRNMTSLIDNFEKAQMLARLHRDLRNLYPIPLTASAPACWPQAVLWYITDLALVNSWLQYRQEHNAPSAPLTLMAFRLEVSKALILSSGSDTQDSVPPQPPLEQAHPANESQNMSLVDENPLPDAATRYDGSGHWPEQLGEGEGGRCRFGDCQRTSRVLCLKCCVFLCISRNHNCFLNFHNQGSIEKN